MNTREQTAQRAAAALRAPGLNQLQAVVGFDGFVDEILTVVDKRLGPTEHTEIPTIERFASRIAGAAGQSSNFELVVKLVKLGGNGPIMANALASAGVSVSYIGSVGSPAEPAKVHPVFHELARKAQVHSIAEACHTDALEFADGKLMLGKLAGVTQIHWEQLVQTVGLERLTALLDHANLISIVNWTMLPYMTQLMQKLLEVVWPRLSDRPRVLFVDLADPEKRSTADLVEVLQLLGRFSTRTRTILGLNFKEAEQVCSALGLDPVVHRHEQTAAAAIRERLGLSCVVIHPRDGAGCATADGAWRLAGPYTASPKISTGAGDHFNAGFCLAWILGLAPPECLAMGVATSGYYVRNAASPAALELAAFLDNLPPGQDA